MDTFLLILAVVPVAGFGISLYFSLTSMKVLKNESVAASKKASTPTLLKPLANRKTFTVQEVAEYELVATEMERKFAPGEIN